MAEVKEKARPLGRDRKAERGGHGDRGHRGDRGDRGDRGGRKASSLVPAVLADLHFAWMRGACPGNAAKGACRSGSVRTCHAVVCNLPDLVEAADVPKRREASGLGCSEYGCGELLSCVQEKGGGRQPSELPIPGPPPMPPVGKVLLSLCSLFCARAASRPHQRCSHLPWSSTARAGGVAPGTMGRQVATSCVCAMLHAGRLVAPPGSSRERPRTRGSAWGWR